MIYKFFYSTVYIENKDICIGYLSEQMRIYMVGSYGFRNFSYFRFCFVVFRVEGIYYFDLDILQNQGE